MCVDGECIYREHTFCDSGCLDARCLGFTPRPDFDNSSVTIDASLDASDTVDEDGRIVTYYWDFGDGNSTTTSAAEASHTYAAGTYNITLRVVDNTGLENSTVKETTII